MICARTVIPAALLLALAFPVSGGEPLTSDQGDAILQELRAIRVLLERRETPTRTQVQPARVTIEIDGAPFLGRADAPVTVVAFQDYQCPFCRRFDTQTLPELKRKYIDTGRVRYVVRDLPLGFHAQALDAAQATHCAHEQDRFWEMRDGLTAHQDKLSRALIDQLVRDIGLNETRFGACMATGRHRERLSSGVDEARKLGITGTPTFVIGRTAGDSVEGVRLVGAQPLARFEAIWGELLSDVR